MYASGWPITLLLCCLLGSATSSPVSTFTPAPPLPLQVFPPSPMEREEVGCHLTMSPSSLVVRFGDPVTANCSVLRTAFAPLGWEVALARPEPTMDQFLVWRVDSMTDWSVAPKCYVLSEQGDCHIDLPLTVYKPPHNVSISFVNRTGPMLEGQQYTLQCTVEDVAPVGKVIVTFYRGQTALGQLQSNDKSTKPVNETFSFNITLRKEDNGVQYWCEAKLELGPDGPQPPPVVTSQTITPTVFFGPQLLCDTKLQVKDGECLSYDLSGNPQPLVVWCRDGQVVVLVTQSSTTDAGKYIVYEEGPLGQNNVTVEVLPGSGTTNSCNGHFLLAILLIQMINWL